MYESITVYEYSGRINTFAKKRLSFSPEILYNAISVYIVHNLVSHTTMIGLLTNSYSGGAEHLRYLVSDIHGDLILFKKMLREINFNFDYDELIIIGDILDRNPYGIQLYQFIRPFVEDGTMKLLMGNHELFAIQYLEGKLSEKKWISFGGEHTLANLKNLPKEEQQDLLDFLKGLPLYLEIDTRDYGPAVVTHTGISAAMYVYNEDGTINVTRSIEKAAKENLFEYLISLDLHYVPSHIKNALDRFLFVGHVCTFGLNADASSKIYRTPHYINLDCGAGHRELGGILGCYCVDTDEEFYVS